VNATVSVVPSERERKSPQELEIERISALSKDALSAEDVRYLKRIRDAQVGLAEIDATLKDVKEAREVRKDALDAAISQASRYFDNRQLALSFARP
jgi:hypothetical protein